jgi:RNA-directed DNA polymerase
MAEMPESHLESSGRKSREQGLGASSVTATKEDSVPEEMTLMEAVVECENGLVSLLSQHHRFQRAS